jgi:hypothetical protein
MEHRPVSILPTTISQTPTLLHLKAFFGNRRSLKLLLAHFRPKTKFSLALKTSLLLLLQSRSFLGTGLAYPS